MRYSRRRLLQAASAVTAGTLIGTRPVMAILNTRPVHAPPIQDPRLKELVLGALNIANEAKVTYADVRLSHNRTRSFRRLGTIRDSEVLAASVRVLFNGYWGFACTPIWSTDEMRRITQEAIAIGKTNAQGKQRIVELAQNAVIRDGHWEMPVRLNPFMISPDEILDYLGSLTLYIERTPGVQDSGNVCTFTEQQKAFGSTEGSYYTQNLYSSKGGLSFSYSQGRKKSGSSIDLLTEAGVGWELYRDQPIREAFQQELEEIRFDWSLPVKPVDVGRYSAVFDAQSVGRILKGTIGTATQLTRAMGYDANDSGTSYITDPDAMVGTLQIGSPELNVSCNRDESGGLATVRWDDEGVAPVTTSIIKDGRLNGFSTMRESATWLKPPSSYPQSHQSSGSAYAESAIEVPITTYGNLQMASSQSSDDYNSLIESIPDGVAFRRMSADIDFQCLNGLGFGKMYEIKNGKRVSLLANAGTLFRTPEFWKSLIQIGGPGSARRFEGVTSVPIATRDLTVIDIQRKA